MHTVFPGRYRNSRIIYFLVLLSLLAATTALIGVEAQASRPHWAAGPRGQTVAGEGLTGEELYLKACAACHAPSGKGQPQERLGFDIPPANFTDCNFAVREADLDWGYVITKGGPARGFSEHMPAFGEALTDEQVQSILDHVRTLCPEECWPRGEFNLPLALYTTKAYPEDELVIEVDLDTERQEHVTGKLIFEQRLGKRSQWEVVLPMQWQEQADDENNFHFGFGDLKVGVKHVLYDDLEAGSILSAGLELVMPTGDETRGHGDGLWKPEPYLAFAQLLPMDFFIQAQAGLALPIDKEGGRPTHNEAFWRAALGKSFFMGAYGRIVTPQVEVLGSREWTDDVDTNWDVAPQIQIALNRRQHIRLGVGARIPLNNRDVREPVYRVYLLWDWFDGDFLEGW